MNQETARSIRSAPTNTRVQSLSFAELPHQSRLFLESSSEPAKKYYPNVTVSPLEVGGFAGEVLGNYRTDRKQLCTALTDINRRIDAGSKTFENIDLLSKADAVAVVTGQQAGLFTGPVYTIYKALSAVKLANELSSKGRKAVPVFWVATEDHDFDEVAEAHVLDRNTRPVRLQYKPADVRKNASVGDIKLDSTIVPVIDELFRQLPRSEFSEGILELLRSAYGEGNDLGSAFGRTLSALFSDYGLVVIDPLDKGIKRLAAPIYKQAVSHADEIVAAIREQNSSLDADGFHAQVLVEDDYFPLFLHDDDGKRTALRKAGDGVYRLKGGTHDFTTRELEQIAVDEPERLSPGVMLRGVVQDHLLPTICYFGGAAEIAYFAQNSAAYKILERPVTPIFHRQSFTVVESRQHRVLERFGWDIRTLFDGKERATLAAAADVLSPKMAGLFADVEEKINAELHRLDEALSESDVTLATNLATRRRKIIYHIATLRKKALLAETKKDETMRRQIDDLFNSLLPSGGLQERSLNVFSFINKHGFGFIDVLYDSVDLNDKGHRIVYL